MKSVRRSDETQRVVIHAERRVALEIDARDVGAHCVVIQRRTKSEPAVVAVECKKMRLECCQFC